MVALFVIFIVIGIAGANVINDKAGDYDFITPLLSLGWLLLFVALAIGLLIGKLVF